MFLDCDAESKAKTDDIYTQIATGILYVEGRAVIFLKRAMNLLFMNRTNAIEAGEFIPKNSTRRYQKSTRNNFQRISQQNLNEFSAYRP